MDSPNAVFDFWFDGVNASGVADPACFLRWFRGGAEFDAAIAARFGTLVEDALAGGLASWEADPRSTLALVIVLDQFPRNLFRQDRRAFTGDARALRLAERLADSGEHFGLQPLERYFLYLPFEHAEDPERQDRACGLYRALEKDALPDNEAFFAEAIRWADRHQAAIEKFGRFPGRNAALGRTSTAAEQTFLEAHPDGF